MQSENEYPFLDVFSNDVGIPKENLVAAYAIERDFHRKILQEPDPEIRKELYRWVYNTVHPMYSRGRLAASERNPKELIVSLFARELAGKSILDIGCGNGDFLKCVASRLACGKLVGIDVSARAASHENPKVQLINSDVIDFSLDDHFDVALSDNVFEHIAPQDVDRHLESVNRALHPKGRLILITPNRLFGPSDVTRIVDYTYSNRTPARGTHINETTYTDLLRTLKRHGFAHCTTVLPIPRLKFYLSRVRFDGRWMSTLEGSRFIMRFLHALRHRGRCFMRLDVILICTN